MYEVGCQYLGPDVDPRDHYPGWCPTCHRQELVHNSMYCAEHYDRIFTKRKPKAGKKDSVITESVIVTKVFLDNNGELCYNETVIEEVFK